MGDRLADKVVCAACGHENKPGARFCAACGKAVAGQRASVATSQVSPQAPIASAIISAPVTQPPPQGQYSPDGHWWWNGVQWVPVPVPPAPAAPDAAWKAKRNQSIGVAAIAFLAALAPIALLIVATGEQHPGSTAGLEPLMYGFWGLAGLLLVVSMVLSFQANRLKPKKRKK